MILQTAHKPFVTHKLHQIKATYANLYAISGSFLKI